MTFYVTFGVGSLLADYVFIVTAHNEDDARQKTIDTFGDKWAFIYDNDTGWTLMNRYKKQPIYAKNNTES